MSALVGSLAISLIVFTIVIMFMSLWDQYSSYAYTAIASSLLVGAICAAYSMIIR